MERLTKRIDGEAVCRECTGPCGTCDGTMCFDIGHMVDRLAAYEDTMTIERAKELAQAEKDGRLLVLPDAKYTDDDGEEALRRAMWICGDTNNPVTRYTADAIAEKLCRDTKE